jgi:hypothetical protein
MVVMVAQVIAIVHTIVQMINIVRTQDIISTIAGSQVHQTESKVHTSIAVPVLITAVQVPSTVVQVIGVMTGITTMMGAGTGEVRTR